MKLCAFEEKFVCINLSEKIIFKYMKDYFKVPESYEFPDQSF